MQFFFLAYQLAHPTMLLCDHVTAELLKLHGLNKDDTEPAMHRSVPMSICNAQVDVAEAQPLERIYLASGGN